MAKQIKLKIHGTGARVIVDDYKSASEAHVEALRASGIKRSEFPSSTFRQWDNPYKVTNDGRVWACFGMTKRLMYAPPKIAKAS